GHRLFSFDRCLMGGRRSVVLLGLTLSRNPIPRHTCLFGTLLAFSCVAGRIVHPGSGHATARGTMPERKLQLASASLSARSKLKLALRHALHRCSKEMA